MSYNKSQITDALNKLVGFDVKTFNSKGKMPTGAIGFVDHLVISDRNGAVFFIEVKLKKDTLKKKQQEYKAVLLSAQNKNDKLYYITIDSTNLWYVLETISKDGFK